MSVAHHEPGSDAARLRQRGLRVTGPRLAILAMLEEVGGHRSADELVLALRRAGYHHARTTVYNALDDLARAKLVRAAPVDAGALRYESANDEHHHFVCRNCGLIRNIPVSEDLAARPLPDIEGADADEFDVVYRGLCARCTGDVRAVSGTVDLTEGTDPTRTHAPASTHAPANGTGGGGAAALAGRRPGAPNSISGPSTATITSHAMLDLRRT